MPRAGAGHLACRLQHHSAVRRGICDTVPFDERQLPQRVVLITRAGVGLYAIAEKPGLAFIRILASQGHVVVVDRTGSVCTTKASLKVEAGSNSRDVETVLVVAECRRAKTRGV